MSHTGTVQEFNFNEKSGRVRVKLDGQWYNVGNGVDLSPKTVAIGARISFDSSSSDWNGKQVWWLNKYGQLPPSSNGVHADPAPKAPHPSHPYAAPKAPSTAAGSLDEPMRQTCSNIIANLARAGTIKSPEELDLWVAAIQAAFSRQPGEEG